VRSTNIEQLPVAQQDMSTEVLEGLKKNSKELPSKYFYDKKGSWLFDRICELKEYYPTRTEISILKDNIDEMVQRIGPGIQLIEFGSGSSVKTRILLDHLDDLAVYVPIDISKDHLFKATNKLEGEYSDLEIHPVCADYTGTLELPDMDVEYERRVIFFPGSTIGNFTRERAQEFLGRMAHLLGDNGSLLIGVDLKKDPQVLQRAYDDDKGVTAAFNKNILENINRELGADFNLEQFEHLAVYNEEKGRVEMHLKSMCDQTANVAGEEISFEEGETIHTENSHKYSVEEFGQLASDWFEVEKVWTDEEDLFSVQYLTMKS